MRRILGQALNIISLTALALACANCGNGWPEPEEPTGDTLYLTVGEQKNLALPELEQAYVDDSTIATIEVSQDDEQLLITAVGEGRTMLLTWKRNGNRRSFLLEVSAAGSQ